MSKSLVLINPVAWGLGLLALSLTAGADIYRWTDAQGRVHYSDRPTSENAQHVATSRPTDPEAVAQRNAAAQAQQNKENAKVQEQKADQAAAAGVQQDLAKTRVEQCEKAKKDYQTAIQSQRLYRVGKDGERQYLTDAEISEARVNARKARDQVCGQDVN